MTYTTEEEDTLVALNVIASVFSFIGASFIIGNYWLFEDLRSFAFKLVLFVAVGDMINCIGNFMGSPENGVLCDLQGFITQFGDLTSFGWVSAIAWTIYTVFTAKEPPTIELANKWYKKMHIIIWTSTATLSLLPVTTGSYGPSGGLCWIQGDFGNPVAEAWRWLCFYLPLWGVIGYMIFVYSKVWKELQAPSKVNTSSNNVVAGTNAETGNETNTGKDVNVGIQGSSDLVQQPSDDNLRESNSNIVNDGAGSSGANQVSGSNVATGGSGGSGSGGSNGDGGTLQRIKLYPVVLFVCYFFATIRRLDELFTKTDAPFVLAAIQVFMSALLGTCNACVYGLSPIIRKRDMDKLRTCLGKEPKNTNDTEYGMSGTALAQTERLTEHDGNAPKGHSRAESDNVELGDNQVR